MTNTKGYVYLCYIFSMKKETKSKLKKEAEEILEEVVKKEETKKIDPSLPMSKQREFR